MSDDLDKKKADLLAQVKRVQDTCDGLANLGRGFVRVSGEARDAARYETVIIRVLPSTTPGLQDFLANAANRWGALENTAGEALNTGLDALNQFTVVASGATANASGSTAVYAQIVTMPLRDRQAVEAAEKEFREKTNLGQLLGDIKGEMRRLRLDAQGERLRTPASLLDEAEGAIRVPVVTGGGVTSALLTLRTAINRATEELIRRRPHQEPAASRREKILSIGRQCSKPGLQIDHFERLADDDDVLNGDLSGRGKREEMLPAEVVNLFHSSAQFLRALLMAVDETRLKPP